MTAAAGWVGQLSLHYTHDGERTVSHDRHHGPLRVLKSLYPEGPGICHHVLVHPPGGVVGGDVLALDATLDRGTHALITTPGATRFYRSEGAAALQQAALKVGAGARLEWLPLEAIAHSGCVAENRVSVALAPGAEMIGWDLLALGLPASGEAFSAGSFVQHLELPGRWLERGRVDAADTMLLDSALGWAGARVLATAWFAAGTKLADPRREALLDAARACIADSPGASRAGATSPQDAVIVLRTLADRVEPAMALLARVRAAWRQVAWQLDAAPPRVWRT
ncbi:MAG TPA: urease accessory protein UreD [Rubrivivax sp.]